MAIGGIRVRKGNLQELLKRYCGQKIVKIHLFRAGLLKEVQLKPSKSDKGRVELKLLKASQMPDWL